MPIENLTLTRWQDGFPSRSQLVAVLRQAQIEINYIQESPDERSWGLILKFPRELADLFGVRREILLWASLHAKADARDVARVVETLNAHRIRLAQDVVLMVSADREATSFYEEAASDLNFRPSVVSLPLILSCQPHGTRQLLEVLRPKMVVRDLYDLRSSVTSGNDFFGREEQLTELEREIRSGSSHQGIFGLRKVGKTSLLNRLRVSTQNRGDVLLAQVDLQRSNAINPTAEYLLWHLGETLFDGNRRVRRVRGLRMLGKFDTFGQLPTGVNVFELFDHDLRLVIDQIPLPIILMMDEIERIFPTNDLSPWRTDYVRLWQLLRGIDQEQPGRFRFVISGTNPECVESHSVLGLDNPIYSYFSVSYLQPFSLAESAALLKSYGRLMGLDWSTSLSRRAYDDTGGHPALLRAYASMMHQKFLPRASTVSPEVDDARDVAAAFLTHQGPLLAQVIAILEDQYRDEYEILQTLAHGSVHEFREMAAAFPHDTAHLIGYGLCPEPESATRLRSLLLHTYLQRRDSLPTRRAQSSDSDLIGELVDNRYKVESLVSSKGGYSTVYGARELDATGALSEEGRLIALKVMPHGQLHLLEREVEALQGFAHSNIVRLVNSGRLDDTRIYLAMEFVDGQLLRQFCQAATRPAESTLLAWAWTILDALVELHPSETTIRKLRSVGSDSEIQELLEARYGYIHRDLKPENVIVTRDRGPVLIDFNISVRVSTPVLTVSATPGYLPPFVHAGSWSPRVDLFQLGLTLLQVAAGDQLMETNRDDLIIIMRSAVSRETAAFIERLFSEGAEGFQTAYTARRHVQRLRDDLLR